MKLLLDTNALIWMLDGSPLLGDRARDIVTDPANDVFASVVSLWEMTVKLRIGKLRLDMSRVLSALPAAGLRRLALEPRHLLELAKLPGFPEHKDPFDHLLIAQAIADRLTFVSEDRRVPLYAVRHITCSEPPAAPRPVA